MQSNICSYMPFLLLNYHCSKAHLNLEKYSFFLDLSVCIYISIIYDCFYSISSFFFSLFYSFFSIQYNQAKTRKYLFPNIAQPQHYWTVSDGSIQKTRTHARYGNKISYIQSSQHLHSGNLE